jgi:hypothetical protein
MKQQARQAQWLEKKPTESAFKRYEFIRIRDMFKSFIAMNPGAWTVRQLRV